VTSAEELTAEWVTDALRATGLQVNVVGVCSEQVGTGQMGASHRLHLTYGEGSDDGPATLVAKLAAGDLEARQRVASAYVKEVGFYREVADTVRIRRPHLWHAAIADEGASFTLLLEDLRSSRPGVQHEGCSVDQASDALRNVAGLHAPRWDDPTLLDHDFLAPIGADTAAFLGEVLVGATEDFVARYAGDLDTQDQATLRDAAAVTSAWQLARPEPFGLVHGDYRLDNLMFPAEGPGVCALDWQTVAVGPPLRDVAYFLGNSLLVEDRRRHEERLVAEYHDELMAQGVEGYDADRCWLDYRLGQLQGPMITVLGCMYATAVRSDAADRMFLAMATRSAAAIRDLDPFELL
jgi:hypothetical protein